MTQNKELFHHGILGQKWGVQNGPPYPLKGGSYSVSEKKEILKKRKSKNSIYNKKHFDEVLKSGTTIHTLSYDENRTKDTDMFYAATNFWDRHQYNALFNKPAPKELFDESGNSVGTGLFCKYRIDNKVSSNIKVASEDSGAKLFSKLYSNDRDFYNFVTDPSRMQSYFVKEKLGYKGYREAKEVLDKMSSDHSYVPSSDDLQKAYRMFNYVIPYDGAGNSRNGHDVAVQRAKFFKEASKEGYGALLDTNDAIYGKYKTRAPTIVFDMDAILPDKVYQTKMTDVVKSEAVLVARKALGL